MSKPASAKAAFAAVFLANGVSVSAVASRLRGLFAPSVSGLGNLVPHGASPMGRGHPQALALGGGNLVPRHQLSHRQHWALLTPVNRRPTGASSLSHSLCSNQSVLRGRRQSASSGEAERERGFTKEKFAVRSDAYILDKMRRRVLAGLTPEETREFELLDAQIPFDEKPVCPSGLPLSPIEYRWLELFEKMESASQLTLLNAEIQNDAG
jgi:hypothetical protein